MRQKIIWMQLSTIGLLFSVLFAISGCHTTETGGTTCIYKYKNETSGTIEIEKFKQNESFGSWYIAPQETLTNRTRVGQGDVIFHYSAVRVVFGNDKELWFKASESDKPYSVFNTDNYTFRRIAKRRVEYGYIFSDVQLNMATDIQANRAVDCPVGAAN